MLSVSSVLLVFCVSDTFSATISSPGIQRKNPGDTCTFQWTVTPPGTGYTVYNFTTGTNLPLSTNANYAADTQKGIVTLIISSIELKDAGNYTLSVNMGTGMQTESGALLFVYGGIQSTVVQSSGSTPATQGQPVELNCTVNSTSLPAAYRPTKIYYTWCFERFNSACLKNISSGPAVFQSGDTLTGYSIKNDGRTLVIDSAQYPDSLGVYCRGQEEGSTYAENSAWFNLAVAYQPHIANRNPASGKFNADVNGDHVSYSFNVYPWDGVTQTGWKFVDRTGRSQSLPLPSETYFSTNYAYFAFNLTSENYYGSYSINFSSSIGTTTETFQVLPKGPPDAPSNFQVFCLSHVTIAVQWNVMWDNGYPQTFYLQLYEVGKSIAVANWSTAVGLGAYNSSVGPYYFNSDDIEPNTGYEAKLWSTNQNGPSEVVKLSTTTLNQTILYVTSDDVTFNGSQAIINYTKSNGILTSMSIKCCALVTGNCLETNFTLSNSQGQVIFNNLPKGNEYLFDFVASAGNPYKCTYYADMVKGVRVSRTAGANDSSRSPFLTAVIVLGVLFGLAVLALIGCLVAFFVWKSRANFHPSNTPKQTNRKMLPRIESNDTVARNSQGTDSVSEVYENVDVRASKDEVYYESVDQPDAEAKRNRYT